jgi:SAM-dependent methyltransferase
MSANDRQREYWNSDVAAGWAGRVAQFDRGLQGVNGAVMAFADLKSGMDVLDVGCGAGTTTEEIAAIVTPGRAVGLDISRPLIEAARARSGDAAQFIEADASDYPFVPEFDLVFSRLGVMFFADPVASFANIRKALRPGGRMAFVCWCAQSEISCLWEPYAVVRDLLPDFEAARDNEPGPFGLADAERTRRILDEAGWTRIRIERAAPQSLLGVTPEEAAEQAMAMGPLVRLLRQADDATKARVYAGIVPVLEKWRSAEGISLPADCWLVEAYA